MFCVQFSWPPVIMYLLLVAAQLGFSRLLQRYWKQQDAKQRAATLTPPAYADKNNEGSVEDGLNVLTLSCIEVNPVVMVTNRSEVALTLEESRKFPPFKNFDSKSGMAEKSGSSGLTKAKKSQRFNFKKPTQNHMRQQRLGLFGADQRLNDTVDSDDETVSDTCTQMDEDTEDGWRVANQGKGALPPCML